MGRHGSKINNSGFKIHYFFVPELMVAAVLVTSIAFYQFLSFLFFDIVLICWWWVSQVFSVESSIES